MKVPMLDLVAEHAPYRAELVAAFERVLDSGRFVLGPEVEAFEQEIGKWIGVPHLDKKTIGVRNDRRGRMTRSFIRINHRPVGEPSFGQEDMS